MKWFKSLPSIKCESLQSAAEMDRYSHHEHVAIGCSATVAMICTLFLIHHSSCKQAVVVFAIFAVTALRKSAATVGLEAWKSTNLHLQQGSTRPQVAGEMVGNRDYTNGVVLTFVLYA